MPGRAPLWAPWRMEYIESHDEGGPCIFCAPASDADDRKRLILHRGEHSFVMLNRFPYAVGHLMVAPYAHVARIADLAGPAQADLIGRTGAAAALLERALGNPGLNLGANFGAVAGAGFADHLHFHLVPRWPGDTNFMTVVAETRVMPQHLERTYETLAPLFAELARA